MRLPQPGRLLGAHEIPWDSKSENGVQGAKSRGGNKGWGAAASAHCPLNFSEVKLPQAQAQEVRLSRHRYEPCAEGAWA